MTGINISLDLETWGTTPGSDIRSIGACVFDPQRGTIGAASSTLTFHDGPVEYVPTEAGRNPYLFYVACDNPQYDTYYSRGVGNEMIHHPHHGERYRLKYSLTRDPRTVQWWSEQSDEAQAAFADPVDLRKALEQFGDWLIRLHGDNTRHYSIGFNAAYHPDDIRIWSHGAAFDPPILAAAYAATGLPVPWHYRAPRDTRTLFDAAGVDDHSAWLAARPGPLGVAHHSLDDSICQARGVCDAWARIRYADDPKDWGDGR